MARPVGSKSRHLVRHGAADSGPVQRRTFEPLPPRATVVDDGVGFEVIWNGHRDGPTLLDCSGYSRENHTHARGRLANDRSQKFSWLG